MEQPKLSDKSLYYKPDSKPNLQFLLSLTSDNFTLAKALEYIKSHYTDPGLSLHEIAKQISSNRVYLSRQFKTTTGYTVNDYIYLLRLAYLLHLSSKFQNTPLFILSRAAGFPSYSNFVYHIKTYFGMKPSEYVRNASIDTNDISVLEQN